MRAADEPAFVPPPVVPGVAHAGRPGHADGHGTTPHDGSHDPSHNSNDDQQPAKKSDENKPEDSKADADQPKQDPPPPVGHPGQQRHDVEPTRYNPGDPTGSLLQRLKAKIAGDPLRNVEDWITEGNPHFSTGHPAATNNCGDNSRAFADNLQGGEPRIANGDLKTKVNKHGIEEPKPGEYDEMYQYTGVQPDAIRVNDANGNPVVGAQNPAAYTDGANQAIYNALNGQPPGTAAIIYGHWTRLNPDAPETAHWFNAFVDVDGTVRWADMQSGRISDWPPKYGNTFQRLEAVVRRPGGDWHSPISPSWQVNGTHFTPNPFPPHQPHAPQQHAPQQSPQQHAPQQHPQQSQHPPVQPHAPQQPHAPLQYTPPEPGPLHTPQQPPAPHAPQQPHSDQPNQSQTPHQQETHERPSEEVSSAHDRAPDPSTRRDRPPPENARPMHEQPAAPEPATPRTTEPREIDARLHPDGPPAPRDPHRIEDRLDPQRPRDPREDFMQESRDRNMGDRPSSSEGERPRDPREDFMRDPGDRNMGERSPSPEGERPRDPRQDFMQDRPNAQPERPRDPREDFMQDRPGDRNTIDERLHPDGPPASHATHDPNRIENALHPDGPPASHAPHDPHRIENALNPDGPRTGHGPAPEGSPPAAGAGSPGADGYDSAQGDRDWRPGDSGFGVSDGPGFDPSFHHKPLGDEFAPGVHDPDGSLSPEERAIADRLEQEGWRVDGRKEDHTKDKLKNPECMVRKDPLDEGVVTEFKTPNGSSPTAVRRNVNDASDQVPTDGEVVIDGSKIGLTEEGALRGFKRALGQPGRTVAAKVHFILGDGRVVTYVKER